MIATTEERFLSVLAAEPVMLAEWSRQLAAGMEPRFISAQIHAAVDFEPLLGLDVEACDRRGCDMLVHGGRFCSEACEDAVSEDTEARWHAEVVHRLAGERRPVVGVF